MIRSIVTSVAFAKTAASLATYFKVSLWDRIILQACKSTPPIQHAVIAIGALDLTMDVAQRRQGLSPTIPGDDRSLAFDHRRFALIQYGKAIKRTEDVLSLGAQGIRTALIVCLLTVCFERLKCEAASNS
jgi:hypothetical protein